MRTLIVFMAGIVLWNDVFGGLGGDLGLLWFSGTVVRSVVDLRKSWGASIYTYRREKRHAGRVKRNPWSRSQPWQLLTFEQIHMRRLTCISGGSGRETVANSGLQRKSRGGWIDK